MTEFTAWLQGHVTYIRSPAFWLQMAVLLVAAGIAWAVHRAWVRHSLTLLETQEKRFKQLGLKTTTRIVFPLSMLLVVSLVSSAMKATGLDHALLRLAIPLLVSLAAIRFIVYVLRKAFRPSPMLKAWENAISIGIWVVVALHLLGWLSGLLKYLDGLSFILGTLRVSLLSVLGLILSVGVFLIVAIWVAAFVDRRIAESRYMDRNMQIILSKITKPVLIVLAVIIALDAVGIDLTAFAVFGGALGVGLGFGLQRIASNFISGFILIFDRSIKPGDVISLGESFGWVEALHARYVVIRDRDGVENLIPNENLITSQVINWSYSDRNIRLKLPVQISYQDDPEKAIALMVGAANASPRVLADPQPVARLMEFGDSGITLELRIWINDPENGLSNVRTDIYLAVWKAFKREGITIPFPQRDLHLKSSNIPLT